MKDIVLILSDQHAWAYTGFEDSRLDTPNLERIAKEGCVYERCYCNAPLCVPSRMSFLTGLLPSQLGIFNNDTTIPTDMPTIAHAMGTVGYETVLIGRMHFKGDDQKHGFDVHLAGDITSQYWGTGGKDRADFGAYAGTANRKHCLELVGGGCSPVMAYDENVMETAVKFLEDNLGREGRPPLFLVIGFYGPHFPFVSSPDLYEKYKERLKAGWNSSSLQALPWYEDYVQICDEEKRAHCQAAYYGLIETLDRYVGQLYDLFCGWEQKAGHESLFIYTSDHGEQLGKRGIFGKQTLYEDALRVPLIVSDSAAETSNIRIQRPVSLLDVRNMILNAAGYREGDSTVAASPVRIQQILEYRGEFLMGEAVILFPYKIIRIGNQERVYNLETDSQEEQDIASECQDILKQARQYFLSDSEKEACLKNEKKQRERHERLKAWGKVKRPEEWAVFKVPLRACQKPEE